MKSGRIIQQYIHCILYMMVGLVIFAAARTVMLHSFSLHLSDLPFLFFNNAGRFDMQILAYISAPVVLLIIILGAADCSGGVRLTDTIMRHYYAVMYSLLTLLAFGEFFYYSNFSTRYSSVFFDFMDENPASLLLTIWQDYPIVRILIGMVLVYLSVLFLGRLICKLRIELDFRREKAVRIILLILISGLTFILMRGSLTSYTLQPEAFVVSDNDKVNECVPNAIYMLKKANSERKRSFRKHTTDELLQENGFHSLQELVRTAGYEVREDMPEDSILMEALFTASTFSPGNDKPDIVLILSESWSSFINTMDRGEKLDLLGSLRKHLAEDLTFTNFQSVRSGTIYTIEALTMGMPYQRFFNSPYRSRTLATSIAKPFKENGYSTSFYMGFDQTWENVGDGLSFQYFDNIIGRQHIIKKIPDCTSSLIGVYDEFLFDCLFSELNERKTGDAPRFILALTATNHPPYTFPEGMELPPLNDLWYGSGMLTGDEDVLRKNGLGVQYANRALGDFLTDIKGSDLAGNTIVIATGDHNVRSILNFSEGGVPDEYRYSVPLYVYLPGKYAIADSLKETVASRYGCHFDILPSLARFAFDRGTEYLNLGHDLLDPESGDRYFSYNENRVLSPYEEQNDSLLKMMKARELLMKIYIQKRIHGELE